MTLTPVAGRLAPSAPSYRPGQRPGELLRRRPRVRGAVRLGMIRCHTTRRRIMPTRKVAVTIDTQTLQEIDQWVAAGEFPSRSRVVRAGLNQLQEQRARRSSLLAELAKLDAAEERGLAEEWF